MKNYRLQTVVCLVLMGLSMLTCGIGAVAGLHAQEQQYAFWTALPYDACYHFRGDVLPEGACMDLNAFFTARAHGRTVKSDKLMQSADGSGAPWMTAPALAPNEVWVSENLLRLYGLAVGDVLTVQRVFSPAPTEYRITGALPPCYGLDTGFTDAERGVLLFGYNAALTTEGPFDFRVYATSDWRPSTMTGAFTGVTSARTQSRESLRALVQTLTLLWCILLICDGVTVVSLVSPCRAYLRRLHHSGAGAGMLWRRCAMLLTPLFLCRGWMLLFGGLHLYATGSYGFLLVNALETLTVLGMVGLQAKQIERSAS